MHLDIDLTKSVDENAAIYFELAKKAKRKIEGAKKALEDSNKKLTELQKKEDKFWEEEKHKQAKKEIKHEWYEKFHWFMSSEGFLCIGGKDSTSNELVIKKHTDPNDLVMHTDMAGSPFFVIKDGQKAGDATIEETAQAVGCHSRAWKLGHSTADVFYAKPEQISKEAKAGEYLSKGSFVVQGKVEYQHPKLEFAIGLTAGTIIGGPVNAIKKQTSTYVIVIPGKDRKSAIAKKIKAKLKGGDLDDIVKFLPAGESDLKK